MNKPKIEQIKLSDEKLKELKEMLNSSYSQGKKRQALRKIVGGSACCVCAGIPTKKVSLDVGDSEDGPGRKVNFYCHKDYQKWLVENKR